MIYRRRGPARSRAVATPPAREAKTSPNRRLMASPTRRCSERDRLGERPPRANAHHARARHNKASDQ
eukprot:11206010-Lingulodinium_polyedra.AAC.1